MATLPPNATRMLSTTTLLPLTKQNSAASANTHCHLKQPTLYMANDDNNWDNCGELTHAFFWGIGHNRRGNAGHKSDTRDHLRVQQALPPPPHGAHGVQLAEPRGGYGAHQLSATVRCKAASATAAGEVLRKAGPAARCLRRAWQGVVATTRHPRNRDSGGEPAGRGERARAR